MAHLKSVRPESESELDAEQRLWQTNQISIVPEGNSTIPVGLIILLYILEIAAHTAPAGEEYS